MNYLLTNDDGIDADGLQALRRAVKGRVCVAAPALPMSECGHSVTTKLPIRCEERSAKEFAVHGSPADCVRLAVRALFADIPFDAVLSGINQGGNLGADVYMSGTVAAAREAAFLGIPSIAVSQYVVKNKALDWRRSQALFERVFSGLNLNDSTQGWFWNVNLPHLDDADPPPAVHEVPLSKKPMPVRFKATREGYQYAGRYPDRDREKGSDVDLCFNGNVTLSKVAL